MTKEELRALGGKIQETINASGATGEEVLLILLGAAYGSATELGLAPRELFQRAAHVWDGRLVRPERTIEFPRVKL